MINFKNNGQVPGTSDLDIRESPGRWAILATTCTGSFMVAFYISVVIIALPTIMKHFEVSLTLTAWVMLIYTLGLTSFLLPFGRLSDIVGKKRIYSTGCVGFTAATMMAGLAPNIWLLLGMRFLEAVGAAMIMSNGFAIITTVFPHRELGKALGINTAVSSLGVSLAPLLGGLMLDSFGWRAIFFFNVPFGIAVSVLSHVILKEKIVSPFKRESFAKFDIIGMLTIVIMLSLLQLGLSWGQTGHWSSSLTIGAFSIAAISLVFFLFWEARYEKPLVPLSLFRIRPFSAGILARMLYFLSYAASYLMVSFFLQIPLGYSALKTGLLMVPSGLSLAIVSPVSGWLSDKLGHRSIAVTGMLTSAVAMLGLSRLSLSASYGEILLWLVLVGVGQGLFHTPNMSLIMGMSPRERYAIASSLLGVVREVAFFTGIGLATTVLVGTMVSLTGTSLIGELGSHTTVERVGLLASFMLGYQRVYVGAVVICLIAAALSLVRATVKKNIGQDA